MSARHVPMEWVLEYLRTAPAPADAFWPGRARADWAKAAEATRRAPAPIGVDLSRLPSGRYAVPGGETRLKVEVDNVADGKWRGWVFVRDAAEYGKGRRYGRQRPGERYSGDVPEQMAAIAADPQAASAAYGRLVGRCGVCGRPLENEESVARGIGPVCAAKMGWS